VHCARRLPPLHSSPSDSPTRQLYRTLEMRLLDVNTLKLHTFYGDAIPRYAILSHNWLQDDEEITFQQIQDPDTCRHKQGFRKIELLCEQAQRDDWRYAWIDTACIDKTNSSELSEAINSMFAWYRRAEVCYAYLADISDDAHKSYWNSRWWTRAWYATLKIEEYIDCRLNVGTFA